MQAFASAFPKGLALPNGTTMTTANFKVLGGYLFADANHRNFFNSNYTNFMPRIGFAYQLDAKTVIRGGWALYTVPKGLAGVNQASAIRMSTTLTPSGDGGLTFLANPDNLPSQSGLDPTGSKLGMLTSIRRWSHVLSARPEGRPFATCWSVSVQRQVATKWFVEVTYTGNHGYDLPVSSNYLDAIPWRNSLSTSSLRDTATISALGATVTNPFYGITPGTSYGISTNQSRSHSSSGRSHSSREFPRPSPPGPVSMNRARFASNGASTTSRSSPITGTPNSSSGQPCLMISRPRRKRPSRPPMSRTGCP